MGTKDGEKCRQTSSCFREIFYFNDHLSATLAASAHYQGMGHVQELVYRESGSMGRNKVQEVSMNF
jgi:hypothetical protein